MNAMNAKLVSLPCLGCDPVLARREPLPFGRLCVYMGVTTATSLEQLAAVLATQRPSTLVLTSVTPVGEDELRQWTTVAFRHCGNVSVVGSFRPRQTLSVRLANGVAFTLVDTAPGGSTQTSTLTVHGELHRTLRMVVIMHGQMFVVGKGFPPGASIVMMVPALVVNGYAAPSNGRGFEIVHHPPLPTLPPVLPLTCPPVPPPVPPPAPVSFAEVMAAPVCG